MQIDEQIVAINKDELKSEEHKREHLGARFRFGSIVNSRAQLKRIICFGNVDLSSFGGENGE